MNEVALPRVVIAGTNSGVGKTTIVTGLLAALDRRGYKVQPFKVGPDYIDPGFHALAAGRSSYNLDTWLVPEEKLATNFFNLAKGADIAVIEGVMGLYDGGAAGVSSTAEIAKKLAAPVVLVINAQSMGQSAAALALGYHDYDPEVRLAGVILNRVGSDRHAQIAGEAIESLGIKVLGVIRRNEELQTPERHLGLTPVAEVNAQKTVAAMGETMEASLDLNGLVHVAKDAPPLSVPGMVTKETCGSVKIGIAQDEAFSFYYPTSLAYLESLGATLIPFSPLRDHALPEVDGVILGGGFPEMFLSSLADNVAMKTSLSAAARRGMPIYAECGGLMYLCRTIRDFKGDHYEMVGVIPAVTEMRAKLQRIGYVTAVSVRDSIFGKKGMTLRGHEFHFSIMRPDDEQTFPWAYELKGTRQRESHREGFASGNVLASYLHLAFDGSPQAAKEFLTVCAKYRKEAR